jgi:peroxiredoxin Q/BCP
MKSIKLFAVIITIIFSQFVIQSCGGNAENISVGSYAPDFTLSDAFGNNYTLSSYRSQKPVVIYFYPKANTPGCTKQACGIRDNFDKFDENGIAIFGISVDSKEDLKEFINEHNLNFPLLSDESKEVSKAYGVLNDLGIDSRITFIVDKEGKIAEVIRDVDVTTHAEDVLKLALNLK